MRTVSLYACRFVCVFLFFPVPFNSSSSHEYCYVRDCTIRTVCANVHCTFVDQCTCLEMFVREGIYQLEDAKFCACINARRQNFTCVSINSRTQNFASVFINLRTWNFARVSIKLRFQNFARIFINSRIWNFARVSINLRFQNFTRVSINLRTQNFAPYIYRPKNVKFHACIYQHENTKFCVFIFKSPAIRAKFQRIKTICLRASEIFSRQDGSVRRRLGRSSSYRGKSIFRPPWPSSTSCRNAAKSRVE